MSTPEFSVVIPAYNEEKRIGTCLTALVRQDTTNTFEVILVDNGSSDQTIKKAKEFSSKLKLSIVKETKRGRGAARSTGFAKAQGRLIFSTDADAWVPKNWLRSMSETLDRESAIAVGSSARLNDLPSSNQFIVEHGWDLWLGLARFLTRKNVIAGYSFAVRADVYRQVGGFKRYLRAHEDSDLSLRLAKVGRIAFCTDAKVSMSGRRFSKGFVKGSLPYFATVFHIVVRRKLNADLPEVE